MCHWGETWFGVEIGSVQSQAIDLYFSMLLALCIIVDIQGEGSGPLFGSKYTQPTNRAFSFHYKISTPNPVAAYEMLASQPQGSCDQTPLLPNEHSVGGLTPCILYRLNIIRDPSAMIALVTNKKRVGFF